MEGVVRSSRPPRLPAFDYSAVRTYFVTACIRNRERVFSDPEVAAIARDVVLTYRERGRYYLYAYCIMPDHIHLLLKLRARSGRLSTLVAVLKASIRHAARHLDDVVWMRGFHERVKREYEDPNDYVKYTLLNPVRAGLVRESKDYPFLGCVDTY
ncbi:MAG TPA: transposase [Candidatus Acidoferrales bacterium]|nr:transposase [Candidatus Acidoferrales bacterium]